MKFIARYFKTVNVQGYGTQEVPNIFLIARDLLILLVLMPPLV